MAGTSAVTTTSPQVGYRTVLKTPSKIAARRAVATGALERMGGYVVEGGGAKAGVKMAEYTLTRSLLTGAARLLARLNPIGTTMLIAEVMNGDSPVREPRPISHHIPMVDRPLHGVDVASFLDQIKSAEQLALQVSRKQQQVLLAQAHGDFAKVQTLQLELNTLLAQESIAGDHVPFVKGALQIMNTAATSTAVPAQTASGDGAADRKDPEKGISHVPTHKLIVMAKDEEKGAATELLSRVKNHSGDFTSSDLENILNQTEGSGWDAHRNLVTAAWILISKRPELLTTAAVPRLVHLGKIPSSKFRRDGYGMLCDAIQKRPDIFDSATVTDIRSGSYMHEAVLELVKLRPELFTRAHFERILAHSPNPWSDEVFFKLLAKRPDFYADPFVADLIRVAMAFLTRGYHISDGAENNALNILTAVSNSHPLRFNRDQIGALQELGHEKIVNHLKAAREAALTATPK